MEKYTFEGHEYEVEELTAGCCTHAVMAAHPDWTQEEAEKATFKIYHDFGVTLKLWASRSQRLESLRKGLLNAYASGSTQDAEAARKETQRLESMTDADYDKEQEGYWLDGYSEQGLLAQAKEAKLKEITAYDESDAVNGFEVAGMTLWFDPDTRVAIEKGVRNCQTVGRESYEAWLDALGTTVSVPCDTALQMLAQIEVYALDCMNTTNKHKAAVKALTTVDEVAAYDYKSGYPTKLTFSL